MDKFKIITNSRNPTPVYSHLRRKSDQYHDKDNSFNLPPQGVANRSSNLKIGVNKSMISRNSNSRNSSGEMKKKVLLDLSKIRITKNVGQNGNNSARNAEHQKANTKYIREKSGDFSLYRINTERAGHKENFRPFGALENAPDIQMLCCNRFFEKLPSFEEKLSHFYAKK